jgi:hypothetical protein
MLSKALATGLIILFVTISINPGFLANDLEKDIKSGDEYKEIVTYIMGMGFGVNLSWINKIGNYRGEAIITMGEHGALKLHSFIKNNRRIVFIQENVSYIHAYRFIGYYKMGDFLWPEIRGIAIGDIEWNH